MNKISNDKNIIANALKSDLARDTIVGGAVGATGGALKAILAETPPEQHMTKSQRFKMKLKRAIREGAVGGVVGGATGAVKSGLTSAYKNAQSYDDELYKEAMRRKPVESSNINSIGHNFLTKNLEIEFKGGNIYRYKKVPRRVYKDMLNSDSKGRYFAQHIRYDYPYKKYENSDGERLKGEWKMLHRKQEKAASDIIDEMYKEAAAMGEILKNTALTMGLSAFNAGTKAAGGMTGGAALKTGISAGAKSLSRQIQTPTRSLLKGTALTAANSALSGMQQKVNQPNPDNENYGTGSY